MGKSRSSKLKMNDCHETRHTEMEEGIREKKKRKEKRSKVVKGKRTGETPGATSDRMRVVSTPLVGGFDLQEGRERGE